MNYKELMANLKANAQSFAKPAMIEVPNIGKIYVRKRTIAEFEAMAELKDSGTEGKFAGSLARLLCDEAGQRFPPEECKELAKLLALQPEAIFHSIVDAADGGEKLEAKDGGN
jgi:hypothetical protein